MIESGGAKFLRLLQALIEATRDGRIEWLRIEGRAAQESVHDRLHPGDEYGADSFEGAFTAVIGHGTEAVLRLRNEYWSPGELVIANEPHGRFGLLETDEMADLFADLKFLIAGGGDRPAARRAPLAAVEGKGVMP